MDEHVFDRVFINFKTFLLYMFGLQHFEKLVKIHFRERASMILDDCHLYCKGAIVGSLSEHQNEMLKEGAKTGPGVLEGGEESSQGFRLVLAKIVPKLEEALEQNKVEYETWSDARQIMEKDRTQDF